MLRGVTVGNAAVAGAIGLSAKMLVQSRVSAVGAIAPPTITGRSTTAVIPYLVCT